MGQSVSTDDVVHDERQKMESSKEDFSEKGQQLGLASNKGDMAKVKRLLKEDPNLVRYQDSSDGQTALHKAAYHGNNDICFLLLEKGVNIKATNEWNRTAEQWARDNGQTATADMLRDWSLRKPSQASFVAEFESTGKVSKDLLRGSSTGKKFRPAEYISGKKGVMLVKTASLAIFLKENGEMTSEDLKKIYWQEKGNLDELIPPESFKEVQWENLASTPYAVMSYQWQSNWGPIVEFILYGTKRVKAEYMWIDVLCLNQIDPEKMTTIKRSDDIYENAKEYHLMEIGSLFRGWVLFELASVKKTPSIHLSNTQDRAGIDIMKDFLRSRGFDGCKFTEEADRALVKKKIINRYGSVPKFNELIVVIVDKLFT